MAFKVIAIDFKSVGGVYFFTKDNK